MAGAMAQMFIQVSILAAPCTAEWALLNIIPHGELANIGSEQDLAPTGYARAKYLARCASTEITSLAFPLGSPTKLLASVRNESVGQLETLAPLGRKLNVPIDNNIQMTDVDGFVRYVQGLPAGGSLLVAWQRSWIPRLTMSMDPDGLSADHYPTTCKYKEWTEPRSTSGACHDIMWQSILFRETAHHPWRIQAFSHMHMGFGGKEDSRCASALYPHSNPTGWKSPAILGTRPFLKAPNSHPTILGLVVVGLLVAGITLKKLRTKRWSGIDRAGVAEFLLAQENNSEEYLRNESISLHSTAFRLVASSIIACMCVACVLFVPWGQVDVEGLLPKPFLVHFCVGGVSGALAKTIFAPMERVKLLIQTQDKIPGIMSGEVPRYSGIIDCFVRVWREQGWLSFWRGNLPNVLRYFPVVAFNFAFKDQIQALFPRYDPQAQFLQLLLVNLASGGIAGAGSLAIVYPLDYARTRLAGDIGKDEPKASGLPVADQGRAEGRQFKGLGDCLMKTIRSQGFFALYSGFAVSVAGIVMYRAPYFGLFDTFDALNPFKHSGNGGVVSCVLRLLSSYVVAQTTSAIAAFVSYPFDTVRRRLQMEADTPCEERQYKNAFHCGWVIVRKEGTSGLFKGFVANLFRSAGTAVVLVLFQEFMALFGET